MVFMGKPRISVPALNNPPDTGLVLAGLRRE